VHDPDILLLDEPTAGVDPQSRNAIFDHLEALKRAGKALVYTTHYMEEAERLADRIVVIDHGRVVAAGTQAELRAHLPASDTVTLELAGEPDAALLALLAERGVPVRSMQRSHATLEDVFLALTGRQLRD
jgi:ABC-2 type transport system ATP-binding protein